MATQVMAAALGRAGVATLDEVVLRQYGGAVGEIAPISREVPIIERPPMRSVAARQEDAR